MNAQRWFSVVSVLLAACGESSTPLALSSRMFPVDVRLSRADLSVSSPSDSLLLYIRVRNPYPTAATVRQPMPDYSAHLWWTVELQPIDPQNESRPGIWLNGFDTLTIPAGSELRRTVVIEHRIIARWPPGEYRLYAGPLWTYGEGRRIRLTP